MKEKKKEELFNDIPLKLPVIPTMDIVVFPHMVVPLLVTDTQIIQGIEKTLQESKKILLLATKEQESGGQSQIGLDDLHTVGTIGNIMRVMKIPEGGIKVLVQGLIRATVKEIKTEGGILSVQLNPLPYQELSEAEEQQLTTSLRNISSIIDSMSASGKIFGPDSQIILSQIKDPEKIADFILSHLNLGVTKAQVLLEQESLLGFLDGIYEELNSEIAITKVQDKVQSNARESINKAQREYFLREQLRAIKKELGDDADSELEELRQKTASLKLSEEAQAEMNKQLKRLEKIPPDSMETTVIRNYIDWILALPWGVITKDNFDIAHAKKILRDDHFGLEEVKDHILDYLSVRSLKENCHTPILCFVGPPGTGKTSLGQSIAKSMGRKFHRISLGGIHDEAEIRGHRRTYVGSMPGRFIQAIRKSGSMNPLIMIDEIDKIGSDQRGDPSSALLEVLDPEQNRSFYDNYLGISFDLSKVLFIATANDLTNIPGPLRDRMEIIQISGYTLDEKIEIALRHLINKTAINLGLEKKNLHLDKSIIKEIIIGYTREAGVRQLERSIKKLFSKYVRSIVEENKQVNFSIKNLHKYLGNRRIPVIGSLHKHKIGVANGLAWTPQGGEVLQVEAVLVPGKGKLLLTGQLGDVMKESAQAAVTYAKTHAKAFGIPKKFFADYDLHIHLPAGAIPKDGPSAGITLLSSVLSALTSRPVNSDFAMTGELNLQGDVLPIGGVKEKILAAKQEGLPNIIVPKLNEQDVRKLGKLKKGLNIILVENVDEVLSAVLMRKARNTK